MEWPVMYRPIFSMTNLHINKTIMKSLNEILERLSEIEKKLLEITETEAAQVKRGPGRPAKTEDK
jgi:hypothetical protein